MRGGVAGRRSDWRLDGGVNCPVCTAQDSTVLETRDTGALVMRYRKCPCGWRWTTHEKLHAGSIRPEKPKQQTLGLGSENPSPVLPLGAQNTAARDPLASSVSDLRSICSSPEVSDLLSVNGRNYNTLAPPAPATATTAARGKAKAISVPVALGFFCEAWRAKYGARYVPSPGECKHLRVLLEQVGADAADLPMAFGRYLEDLSPFVAQDMRHSLLHFCTKGGFNKYRAVAPILTRREAATLAGGEQWLAMHGEGRNGKNGAGR